MPSRLVQACRAASISPRWASASGLGVHAALMKVVRTSLRSVDDSRDRSAWAAGAPLHHAGGAARADDARASEDAAPAATTNSLFMNVSRLICLLIGCGDGDWTIDVESQRAGEDCPAQWV